MVNLFNNFSSPYDDLVNHYGSSSQGAQQGRTTSRHNNPNITVKEFDRSGHQEIQIFNRSGYRNFKIEVVKQGHEFYVMVQSPVDRFEKLFKLNPSTDDLNNVKSQIVNDWLVISVPSNRKQTQASPKKQTSTSKRQTRSSTTSKLPPPTRTTPNTTSAKSSSSSRTKNQPQEKSSFAKAKTSTKSLFSRGKKSHAEPPSLLEAARRRPFLEEVPDPGI